MVRMNSLRSVGPSGHRLASSAGKQQEQTNRAISFPGVFANAADGPILQAQIRIQEHRRPRDASEIRHPEVDNFEI